MSIPTESLNGLSRLGTLPAWLSAIAQPQQVFESLTRSVPVFASGALRLEACTPKRLRFKPHRWSALYDLNVQDARSNAPATKTTIRAILIPPGQAEPDPAGNRGAFGTGDWHWCLPDLRLELEMQPPETELAAFPDLTDPVRARVLLEESIRASATDYRNIRIRSVSPQIMRYKPGSRCTVLYRLEYPTESSDRRLPDIVVAKTYHGSKGKNAYDGMRALWASPLATSPAVAIAEPLAYLPETKVLLQSPICEERTLKELIRSALRAGTRDALRELDAYLSKTAMGLVALHESKVQVGELRVWEDELTEVRDTVDRLEEAIPSLAGAVTPLLEHLQAIAAAYPAVPTVPSHGTFRPAQVLLHQGQIGFIDFDGFCQAEPALDLALFLGKVMDIGLGIADEDEDGADGAPSELFAIGEQSDTRNDLLRQLDELCERFLAVYEQHRPITRERVWLWETLDVLTIVLHGWTKVKPTRLRNTMLLLEHHLQAHGTSFSTNGNDR